MKSILRFFLPALICSLPQVYGLVPLADHIDIVPEYNASNHTWTWKLVTEYEEASPENVYFPARDADYPDGERDFRPPGSKWDFFGVQENEPLWLYSEGSGGLAWLGFGDTSAGLADPLTFTLLDVTGPEGGHFSMYRVISQNPVVFMSTSNGIGAEDVYQKPAGHHHVSWAFSKKGVWAVTLKVSGLRAPGNVATQPSETATKNLFFAIGERANWRAARFDAETVMDESIAGDLADPDHDGWSNLLEYAFGGNPNANGLRRPTGESAAPELRTVDVGNQKYLAIAFYRHRNAEQAEVEYQVQWQSQLKSDGWISGGNEHEVQIIDDNWERVVVRDEIPMGDGPRFARVAVTGLE